MMLWECGMMTMTSELEKEIHKELVHLAIDNLMKKPPDLEAAKRILKAAILQKQSWENEDE